MVAKQIRQIATKHIDKIILFLFPLFLASINSNWIFTPATNFLPDPWFYLAYFRYFDVYARVFPTNFFYFVERLTWNIPGHYIYQIFSPIQANYVLHLIVYYIAIFSLYGTLALLFNRRTAFLTALLMGGYPWFLRAAGWDYVDGIGIALMLLLLYILTRSKTSQRWKLLLFLAGVVHATLIITNLFWVSLFPGWVVYYLFLNRPMSKEKIWKVFDYFILGNIAITILCALYYHSLTGKYIFIENSLSFALGNIDSEFIKKVTVFVYGHMTPYWLLFPALIAIGAAWRISKPSHLLYHQSFMATTLYFCIMYGCMIFWHFRTGLYLNIFLYSSFTIPAIFLLYGALLASIVDKLSDKVFNFLIGLTLIILVTPFLLVVKFPSLENWQGNTILLIFLGLAFVVSISSLKNGAVIFPILISAGALSFLVGLNSYVFISDPSKNRNTFTAIIEASNIIDSYYPDRVDSGVRIWYREDVNYDTFYGLSSLYLYPTGTVIGNPQAGWKPVPALTFPINASLQDKDNIVIISSNSNANDVLVEANQALAYRDATLELKTREEIRVGVSAFTLYFTEVNRSSE